MSVAIISGLILSSFHSLLGVISVAVGIALSVSAEVRLDHHVSPIWSGTVFIITGILGFICAKMKTAYPIIWFTASTVGSLVVAIVSIQLLYRGRHQRHQDNEDQLTDAALGGAGCECFVCMASFIVSCSMAKTNKKQLQLQRDNSQRTQDCAETSQDHVSDYNEEFYKSSDGSQLPAGPDPDCFPSVPRTDDDRTDFLMPWNLTTDGSLCGDRLDDPDDQDTIQCTVCTTSESPSQDFDVEDTGDEVSPDRATVYTISSNITLQNGDQDPSTGLDMDQRDLTRDELFLVGEKPRLKRIISLIEGECGPFTHNNTT